jgi:ESF2/ABP1 family protein
MGRRRTSGSVDKSSSSSNEEDEGQQSDLKKLRGDDRPRNGAANGDVDDDGGEESDDGSRSADDVASHADADPSDRKTRTGDESEQDQSADDEDEYLDKYEDEEDDGCTADGNDNLEDQGGDQDIPKEKARAESSKESASNKAKKKKKPKVHKLSLAKTEDFNEKLRKRGVVYVARIPPRMTPTKVKALLGEHGEVTRVYLVEEDAALRRKRRKLHGGNGSKRYTEGWVEFASKQVAKHVAASLNASAMTHYKRSPHYGDLWSLKYLKGFKWSHLTEKVAYERRVREQKLRLETMQARRDTVAYKQLVETGKKLDKIEARKRRREEREGTGGGSGSGAGVGSGAGNDGDKNKKAKYQPKQVPQIDADSAQRGASKRPLLGSLL